MTMTKTTPSSQKSRSPTSKPKNSSKNQSDSAGVILPLSQSLIDYHLLTISPTLTKWISTGEISPIQLWVGPRGIGKRSFAHYFSQILLCSGSLSSEATAPEESGPDLFSMGFDGESTPTDESRTSQANDHRASAPCGECRHCKLAIKNQSIDFQEIEHTGDAIKVEQLREIKESSGFGAFDSRYRIFLIANAERMTIQAANSILKLLEEPPTGWIFILTASDTSALLNTIVSRCQVVRFRPLSPLVIETVLGDKSLPQERLELCARLSQGSIGKALALADETTWEKRKTIFRFLETPSFYLNELVEWAAQSTQNTEILIDQFDGILRDLLEWSIQNPLPPNYAWKNSDGALALSKHAQDLARQVGSIDGLRKFWLERAERLFDARKELTIPLNKKLWVQDLLVPWLDPTF